MDTLLWIGFFALGSLFWAWIIFWGGAEQMEGSWFLDVFIARWAHRLSARDLKGLAVLVWLIQGFWFVIGLFSPNSRFMLW